jgi:predicted NAD/FAD-binding protein
VGTQRVAVIGSGIAGLTAAYLLQRVYEVTLFEGDGRLGGHSHTHDVPTSRGSTVAVDSGFIVHNERTYPNLIRLFGELGVPTQASDMSMSVRCDGCGLEYAGAKGLAGLFAQRGNLANGRYLRMLAELLRYYRHARRVLQAGHDDATVGEFLAAGGYSRYFVDHYLVPMVSAVWSAAPALSLRYPARYLFEFLAHHGLLSVRDSPQWRTVAGGARRYVEAAASGLSAVALDTPVRSVTRGISGVEIRDDADMSHFFDRVVLATHADQALELLADPTAAEKEVLSAFTYSRNETWLHTDASMLPRARSARASWNYYKPSCAADKHPVLVSYHMNRLMTLSEPTDYVVTLNSADRLPESSVLETMVYEHPIFTRESVAAQRRLAELTDTTTAYAGAYHGWGFHEDGCRAGVAAAAAFGVRW